MKFHKVLTEIVGGPSLLKKKLTEYLIWYLKHRGNYDAFDAMRDITDIFQDNFGALVSPKQQEAILGTLEGLNNVATSKPGHVGLYYKHVWEAYKTSKISFTGTTKQY